MLKLDLIKFKAKYCYQKCEGCWQYRVKDVSDKDMPLLEKLREQNLITKFTILGNITEKGINLLKR